MFDAVASATGATGPAMAVNLAYPLGDLLLIALLVGMAGLNGWRLRGGWGLIAVGFAMFAIADCFYLYGTATGSWQPGNPLEGGWPLAMLLLGWAAWREPSKSQRLHAHELRALWLPLGFGLTSLAVLVYDHFHRVHVLALVFAFVSMAAVIARSCMMFSANLNLLRHTRDEALTDALTGLGNRRKLTLDLARALDPDSGSPKTMLMLFDLDGFKSYNDLFGHPSGDSLLIRLGKNLEQALAGRGVVYRMGGDEFCALVDRSDEEMEPVIDAACNALKESGDAFSITTSFGSIYLPEEADDPSEALRVADKRLYAHKHGGRSSARGQVKRFVLGILKERNPDLANHVDGVAHLAEAVAARLGLPHEEIEEVRLAAELHDVGKVAIPDEILNKPGPLDENEWILMRRHTIIGERILAALPAFARVATMVRASHECFDGTGYPDGLAGRDIPIGARIVAVCDAYDAMTSDRAYRSAMTSEAALAELRACASTQFDPVVVSAFEAILPEIKAVDRVRRDLEDLLEPSQTIVL